MDQYYVETEIVVRYAETDQMGIAHHSNYPVWFEIGRTDFFKTIGFPYSAIEEKGLLMPLTEMRCTFKYPARYDDTILIRTSISHVSHVKIGFEYQVFNKSTGKLLATGETNHGSTDKNLKPLVIERILPNLSSAIKERYCPEEKQEQN